MNGMDICLLVAIIVSALVVIGTLAVTVFMDDDPEKDNEVTEWEENQK